MIGDIIEIARAEAALGDVTQFRAGAKAAGCDNGSKSEHDNIPAVEGGGAAAANATKWDWASLARMAARLLPVSA